VGKITLCLIVGMVLLVSGVCTGDTNTGSDENAIRKAVQSYVEAFNRADAKAAALHWAKEGTYRSQSDEPVKGVQKIQPALEKFFKENKDLQVRVELFDVQPKSAKEAIVKGFAVFQRPNEDNSEILLSAAFRKEGGQWKLMKVEEEESAVPLTTIAKLGELEWLIGDWVDQDEDSSVETSFRWAKDYSFITGTFRVMEGDRVELEGTQVIGWDPSTKMLRSWIFDNKAGFGEGEWTQSENKWTVKVKSILASGEKASSMNIYKYVNPNTFTWQSVSREVNGQLLPDVEEVIVVRRDPQLTRADSGK
jgi:uncharacterized protein (TIGR02246 family)